MSTLFIILYTALAVFLFVLPLGKKEYTKEDLFLPDDWNEDEVIKLSK